MMMVVYGLAVIGFLAVVYVVLELFIRPDEPHHHIAARPVAPARWVRTILQPDETPVANDFDAVMKAHRKSHNGGR